MLGKSLFAFLAISAAAGVGAQDKYPRISAKTAAAFVERFEKTNAAEAKEWKTRLAKMSNRWDLVPGATTRWIQPSNKAVPCKLSYAGAPDEDGKLWWDLPNARFYWDGDCRDGVAFGIGREFFKAEGELASWLSDYSGKAAIPTNYLLTRDVGGAQYIRFSASASALKVDRDYFIETDDKGHPLMVMTDVLNLKDDRIYRHEVDVAGDTAARRAILPNGSDYVVYTTLTPERVAMEHAPVDIDNDTVGYGLVIEDNGISKKVRHMHYPEADDETEVTLPPSYLAHLATIDSRRRANLAAADQMLEKTHEVISAYKQRICKGEVRVDFLDSAVYGRICLNNGDLSIFDKKIAQQQKLQRQRHARYRTALARRQQDGRKAEAKGAAAGGIAELLQQSGDLTRINTDAPVWSGLPPTQISNCTLLARIVRCATP